MAGRSAGEPCRRGPGDPLFGCGGPGDFQTGRPATPRPGIRSRGRRSTGVPTRVQQTDLAGGVPARRDQHQPSAGTSDVKAGVRDCSDRVQLNTVARPPSEPCATACSSVLLAACARAFAGNVEVIADYPSETSGPAQQASAQPVLAVLKRRPCTVPELASALNLHPNQVVKVIERLVREGNVQQVNLGGRPFYAAVHTADQRGGKR